MRISDWSSDVCSSDLYPSKTGGILHAHATVAPVPLRAFEKVLGRRVVQVDRIIVAHVELDLSQRIIRSGKLYYPAIPAHHVVPAKIVGSLGDRKSKRLNSSH